MLVILTVFFYLHTGFSLSSLNSADNVYSRFPTYTQSFNLLGATVFNHSHSPLISHKSLRCLSTRLTPLRTSRWTPLPSANVSAERIVDFHRQLLPMSGTHRKSPLTEISGLKSYEIIVCYRNLSAIAKFQTHFWRKLGVNWRKLWRKHRQF